MQTRFNRIAGVAGAAALVISAAAGCSIQGRDHAGGPGIVLGSALVQDPPKAGEATTGYLDIRNNGTADRLLSVTTSVGGTVVLRAPVSKDISPVVMHTVADIPIAANATTEMDPDSYHLLISGQGAMTDGKDIVLTLKFATGPAMTVNALVNNPQNGGSSYFLDG